MEGVLILGKSSTIAKNKYAKANYDNICLKPPKGTKALWLDEANRRNMSLNAFIQQAVSEYIALHSEDEK